MYIVTRVAALSFLAAMGMLPVPVQAHTFGEVVGWCTASTRPGDDRLCDAYVSAGLDLFQRSDPVLNAGHRSCPPKGITVKDAIPVLAAWLKRHPESRDEVAAPVAAAALAEKFPCR